jgi:hypothetical protein
MDVLLTVEVEVDGATFRFGAADRATARAMGDVQQLVEIEARKREATTGTKVTEEERERIAVIAEQDLPANWYHTLCEMFVEGVRGWEGVADLSRPKETGDGYEPLPCTPQTIREFPPDLKVRIAGAYHRERARLEERKAVIRRAAYELSARRTNLGKLAEGYFEALQRLEEEQLGEAAQDGRCPEEAIAFYAARVLGLSLEEVVRMGRVNVECSMAYLEGETLARRGAADE